MKKSVLSIAIFAALSIAGVSCSGSADKNIDPAALTDSIAATTDEDRIATYVNDAMDYADGLIKEGKLEEARKFLAGIEPLVKEKAPALASVISTVTETISAAKEIDAESEREAIEEAIENKAQEAADSLTQVASDAADAAKQAAADKLNEAAQNASEKVNDKVKDLLKK